MLAGSFKLYSPQYWLPGNFPCQFLHLVYILVHCKYAAWSDQWKSRWASKQNAYKEFVDVFSSETKSQKKNIPAIQHTHAPAGKNNVKLMRKEIERCLKNSNPLQSSLLNTPGHEISLSKLGFPASKRQRKEVRNLLKMARLRRTEGRRKRKFHLE